FVLASTYLEHLDPAALRYFYASKLSAKVDDFDINQDEFVNKVNSDIVGKVVNLASRTARFAQGTGLSASYPDDGGLFRDAAARGAEVADAYQGLDTARAMRLVMALADRANEYVDRKEPWKLKKVLSTLEGDGLAAGVRELQDVCTVALNLFRQIVVYLTPVLPALAEQTGRLLGSEITRFDAAQTPLLGTPVSEFQHMMARVDPKKFQAMIDASKAPDEPADAAGASPAAASAGDDGAALQAEPLAAECSIDDFSKVDLRVARVLSAELVPGADKLLKLTVSLGGGTVRNIFAGIKSAYAPESLVGRLVVVVANLAPRKMKFGMSEGMVVAAGPGGKEIFILSPDAGAAPGQRIH
ncbi:MAG TPA: methionine--tRNA ligase subunit beta, partial [Polyangiaceae bacterium]